MENISVLRWLSQHGHIELFMSDQVDNPTSGAGAVLFSVIAPADLLILRLRTFNGSTVALEYVIETDTGAGWTEQVRWSVDAHAGRVFDDHFPVDAGHKVRLAIAADADATGVSLAIVEYLSV